MDRGPAATPRGPLGTGVGVNFALFSSHATQVEVLLFDALSGKELSRHALPTRTGDVWHGFLPARRAAPGMHYAFQVHGPSSPENGDHFDPTAALIDPFARALSFTRPLRAAIIDGRFDWNGDRPPAIPWRDTVIYELHPKGFTHRHPGVADGERGEVFGPCGAARYCALEIHRCYDGGTVALPGVRERALPDRTRPGELLGL